MDTLVDNRSQVVYAALHIIVPANVFSGTFSHFQGERRTLQQLKHIFRHPVDVTFFYQKAGSTMYDSVHDACVPSAYHGQAGGAGL